MSKEPCRCCDSKKHTIKNNGGRYGYNRLQGEARMWAESNGLARAEYCVPVRGGKQFSGPDWIKNKCGDGRTGFSTRRRGQDEVRMERGPDGQFKRRVRSLVNKRSGRAAASRRSRRVDGSRVGLISSAKIAEAMYDPKAIRAGRKLVRIKQKSRQCLNRRERVARASTISKLQTVAG